MKVTEMLNLCVGYNKIDSFRVLICAIDEQEAQEIANTYRLDSHMEGEFEIMPFDNPDMKFDCDYVLTYSDSE